MEDGTSGTLVFAVGATGYRVSDVVRAARAWGELAALAEAVREGLACFKRAAENDDLPTPEETEAEAAEFRYARDLITADEALAWLAQQGLTVEDWTQYLQRALLRARWASELADTASRYPVSDQEVAEILHAEGVCSGVFGQVASRLAGRVAVLERAREEKWLAEGGDDPDLTHIDAALERFRAHVVTPATIHAEVAARHLDWVRLECETVWFSDVQQAREAALCVRDDGRELGQVAADARAPLRERRLYLEEAEPSWRDRLLAARAGDLLGPLGQDDGFVLVLVRSKELPRAEDEDVRDRAEESLLGRAVDHEVANRVKWHHRL